MKLDQKLNYLLLFTIVLTLLLIVVMTMKSKESMLGGSIQAVSSNKTGGSGFSVASAVMNAANSVVTGTAVGHKNTVEMARHVKEFCDKYGHKQTAYKMVGSKSSLGSAAAGAQATKVWRR
jgi:hypothetical protein